MISKDDSELGDGSPYITKLTCEIEGHTSGTAISEDGSLSGTRSNLLMNGNLTTASAKYSRIKIRLMK